jgi:hypothetical protein
VAHIETNIYLVKNSQELNCRYKTYKLKGLPHDSDDYHKVTQFLVDHLSRKTKSPCALLGGKEAAFLAQPQGYDELPPTIDVLGSTIKIEKYPKLEDLDFSKLNPQTARLAQRFLDFALQQPL